MKRGFTVTVHNTNPNSEPVRYLLKEPKRIDVFKAYVRDKRYRDKRKYIQLKDILSLKFEFVADVYEATAFVDTIDYNPTRALYLLAEQNKFGKQPVKLICGWCHFDGDSIGSVRAYL